MKRVFYLLLLIFIITGTGCGGGGGGGGSSSGGSGSSTVGASSTEDSVMLSWTAPSTNADGSELTDLAGYKIYYGSSRGSYTGGTVEIDSGSTTSYDIESVASGYSCFVVVAVDDVGNESDYSNEVCTTL